MGVMTVRKLIVLLVADAAIGASPTSARSDCAKLRAAMGATAFSQAYATFGACVSRYAPIEQQVTTSAKVTCTAQQADPDFAATHGGKTFDQFYGKGKKDRNAFANCVSIVAKANRQAEQQGRLNPAQTCRALRTQLGVSLFDLSYGKNKNDRNAFGKCVSATARLQAHNELSASATCATQQSDPNFASNHGGQTFDQFYGTNADQSNAFGKCVSSTAKTASTLHTHAIVHAALTCKADRRSDPFAPNLPTEEVFTMPHKDRVEGHVRSTKPLSYGGTLIEDFSVTFQAGRVVRHEARRGDVMLRQLVETDEGAARLGEIALVPHSSPVSQPGSASKTCRRRIVARCSSTRVTSGTSTRSSPRIPGKRI